ncbi:tripartite tricarboxylate transporter substrate binding protein [Halobacillus halophilus]|uniref:tripartite tricarboxylate transporter substrate binding protein n=1 Tax=Halobacillus halophilus TaxID=1570 RepID=UPI00136A350C|nr:tripartite tricarboxylate transporter substrate binding protein [Halobacillus halophilus]MYL30816.1 tripartite tricarboxylate transporter substrate binding protein [Halobacillus halophilus]
MKKIMGALILGSSLVLSACSSAGGSTEAEGESYPEQPVQIVVPWDAGGDTDAINRVIAEELEKELEQDVIVKNISGGSGVIGAQQTLDAKPDGYTLLAIHDSMAMSELMGQADFGYFDFQPVSLMTSTYDLVATHPENPWDNMEDVVADAEGNPESITYAASIGSTSQLEPALIQTAADIQFNIVGYEGTAKRMKAIVANDVHLGSVSIAAGKEYMADDRMKLLGYTGEERSDEFPDVPTLKEQGIDVTSAVSRGIAAPKDTPEAIVEKLSDALQNVAESESFQERMEELGSEVSYKNTEEYVQFLEENEVEMKESLETSGLLE